MSKVRFISCQVLLNKDGSIKARRFYAIPEPAVVTCYYDMQETPVTGVWEDVKVGILFQDWNTRDVLDFAPPMADFWAVMRKHFGLYEGIPF